MLKTSPAVCFILFFIFTFYAVGLPAKGAKNQNNNAPVVKINLPANNGEITAGTQIHYSIAVSDKEDGDSRYDEINPKEVLLEVRYNSAGSTPKGELNKNMVDDPQGLTALRISNCFNCHGFDTKVIGPTFSDINKRYKPTAANMALLAKRIREGSTGIWGDVAMPSHPELSKVQIDNMVRWITQNATQNGVHYYIGTQGVLSLKELPAKLQIESLTLIASYTDHGVNNKDRLKGQDIALIKIK